MKRFLRIIFLVLLLSLCVSCARKRRDYSFYKYDRDATKMSSSELSYQRAYREIQEDSLEWQKPTENVAISEADIQRQYLQWELWGRDYDLKGGYIENSVIKSGDELSFLGNFKGSLEAYQRAKIENLTENEREALVARIASTELALDRPNDALATISNYIKDSRIAIEDVNKYFALILAYAYGRASNFDQSLAWFSKVNRLEQDRTLAGKSAKLGASMLLSSVSDNDLESLSMKWGGDSFVYNLIGIERQKRMASGQSTFAMGAEPFWSVQNNDESMMPIAQSDKKVIAVLLPLSGKYKKLGENTKKGISLATSSMLSNQGFEINFFDTKGDAYYAENLVNQILQNQNVVMFLGPLLSDVSERVSYLVRNAEIPMLTFSKSDSLELGYGVFRLGITPESEINSLISALTKYRNITRYAVIYPENDKGNLYLSEFKKIIPNWQGAELVYEGSYYPDDSNSFLLIASDLERRGVEAVLIPDSLRTVAKFKYSLSPSLKSKLLVIGPSSWDNQDQLISASAALDGLIFISPFFDKDKRELVSKFVSLYQAKYKEKPDFLSAQGFDAITMIFASIKIALEESSNIEEAFSKINSYNGLTGLIQVEDNGDIHRGLTVVEWKNRTREDISTIVPQVKNKYIFQ
ncbi:MAG: penicillin-binding protein activator [Bdellovibrionota bacterium]